MSESEIATLRAEIRNLAEKSDRQHSDNQKSQQEDREAFRTALQLQQDTFARALEAQRNTFQDAINKQFQLHTDLNILVTRHALLIENVIGDGQPEKGRLGVVEKGLETMKKFRWQALSVISLVMWVTEMWIHGHGR
jgi:hypothetical protein